MKETITTKGNKYDAVYEFSESEIKGHLNIELKSYILHDGYKLFEVCATYAKQLTPTKYYVIAKNKAEAKTIFKNKYTWLNIISSVSKCSKETINMITNNPKLYPIT